MKKIVFSILAAFMCIAAFAQDQEYSTTWPYLYSSFQDGTVYLKDGGKADYQVNIHILKGRLHYLENGLVKEAFSSSLLLVTIGEDKYMCVGTDMMKVVASQENGFVAAHYVGDFAKLNDNAGAYGTSTTNSATQKLTSIQIAGQANQNHMEMWESRHNGESVDLLCSYYIVTPAVTCKATKKGVEEILDNAGKAEFKTWLKCNKIKWNDPQSLLKLADFLSR